MAKPANSISTVKLPGDTDARPIVPYYVGYSVNNNYVATLPQLTSDAELLVNNLNQIITSTKIFSGSSISFTNGSANGTASISFYRGGDSSDHTESLFLRFLDHDYEARADLGNRGWSFDNKRSGQITSTVMHVDSNYFYIDSNAIKFGGTKDYHGWETNVKTLLFPTMSNGATKTIATVDQIPAPTVIPIEDLTNLVS